ncbi:MAG TPA: NADH-quinone oxidoreductase subunit C [Terriglobales bacterium]|nr:NADH-quinone oxidoreductase subunit C [Terriglobales bacterium]
MPEETKSSPPPSAGQPKVPAREPVAGAPPSAAAEKSPAGATSEKPAGAAKPAGPLAEPWTSPLVAKLKARYGSGVCEAASDRGQAYLVLDRSITHEILGILCEEEEFDYCVDITAVHYPKREKPFDLVWILYSFPRNERLRVKTMIAEQESFPSSTSLWSGTNWLEREVYDMFGIRFDGHPDLRRILLPEDWRGHPLRKDYGIIEQDQEWVEAHLGIESGQ